MKNLVLITSEFPYFSGEPFLLNELPYLSQDFEKIYIFAINAGKEDKPTRAIPENAFCFPLNNTVSKGKYFRYIVQGLINQNRDLRIQNYSPNVLVSSLYTRGRAKNIARKIYSIITNQKLNVDNVTIYSFWFAYQAVAAWLLSDKLVQSGSRSFAIARAHGYDLYWERVKSRYLPYQEITLKKLRWCFPCSVFGEEYLLKKYPWAIDKVKTARLGTMDYGLNKYNGEKTFVTCGNLESLKRIKLFAEAFCELAKKDKNLKWICIGSGEESGIIDQIVAQHGVKEQVRFTGRLSYESVMDIYKNEGVAYFCNVSVSEGLPVSIMEAISFGIPVIATNVGGTSELVDSTNGLLLSPDIDKKELIESIRKMLSISDEEYLGFRLNSRIKWQKYVSADSNYRSFSALISNM